MILDEIYALVKHSYFSYKDLEAMPTYKRRYFISKLKEDIEHVEQQNNEISNNIKRK